MKSRLSSSFQSGESVESLLSEQFSTVSNRLQERMHEAENFVRREPTKAVFYSVLAGYVLRILPVAFILGLFVRAFMLALRPAALLFGAAKVWEMVQSPVPQRRGRTAE